MEISIEMVSELIATQFPTFANLPIKAVEPNGWDNHTFRLGNTMSVRLPREQRYAEKIPIEQNWLPKLAPNISFPIPKPIAMGKPSRDYPWEWTINEWIEGETVSSLPRQEGLLEGLAIQLAHFLNELEAIDISDAPKPGKHNFLRGASPIVYDSEVREAIEALNECIDVKRVTLVWERAITTEWKKAPVWIHGDLSADNILVVENQLAGVIDFGGMAIGDPSCDLVIAWTYLKKKSRDKFFSALNIDEETKDRARGWALWKALITLKKLNDKTSSEGKELLSLIDLLSNSG